MRPTEFRLRRAGDVAVVTIDNDEDHTQPTTLGRHALESLGRVLDELERGEFAAAVVTGKPFVFCVGADIDEFPNITPERAREGSRAGHELFGRLRSLPYPTVAAVNGACLGGGLEVALHCSHRTISTAVRHFGAPEVFLGLFPAWGATQLVPRLVGVENAVKVIVENPLRQNRMLDAQKAFAMGFADRLLEPVEFVDESIAFARVLAGVDTSDAAVAGPRPGVRPPDVAGAKEIVRKARLRVDDVVHGASPAPYVALDLIEGAATWSLEEGYRREEDAVAELLPSRHAQASIYAFNLVERRAKRGVGVPEVPPRRVQKVGIVGAGLMASQLAALFLRRLEVPIVLRDIDAAKIDEALDSIRGEVAAQVAKGRYDEGKARFLAAIVSGSTSYDGFADCDLVLEAVFEQMDVKKQVVEEARVAAPDAIVATNTSSLSVAEMGADVGLHFFNPVALMPLVEIVRHDGTSDETLATAWDVTRKLRKTGVVTADAPGFVVNRVLTRMTRVLMDALEHGNSEDEVDEAMLRLGFPMAPSVLLQVVGPRVANHVLETMHTAYPDRFPLSPALAALAEGRDPRPVDGRRRSVEEISEDAMEAVADEIARLLEEGVVAAREDVDTCLLLGAGWPFFMGGATPYLDATGISQRVTGRTFGDAPARERAASRPHSR